jgi:peptidoglycan hydrolase-like protein with peptidoglycan-binding domain
MYLMIGAVGPNVAYLQQMLNYLSGPWSGGRKFHQRNQLVVDGKFGPLTRARVVAFQKMSNLSPDGIVGPITSKALLASVLYALCFPFGRSLRRPGSLA